MVHRIPGHLERHEGAGLNHARISHGLSASGATLAVSSPGECTEPPRAGKSDPPKPISGPPDASRAEFATFSDAELLELFEKSSDEWAFSELYNRHKAEIYTYCVRMMSGDRDKASDVFQEVFIKAFEKARQFREGTNVAGWLYVIARNLCLNAHRNERPAERLDMPDAVVHFMASTDRSLAPEYDEEQHFLRRKLEEALAKLPLEFREPFMLREFDGFSYREIATMTGTTMGMTKVRIYRAKQQMRELLASVLEE